MEWVRRLDARIKSNEGTDFIFRVLTERTPAKMEVWVLYKVRHLMGLYKVSIGIKNSYWSSWSW
jgi:hypothetical protein